MNEFYQKALKSVGWNGLKLLLVFSVVGIAMYFVYNITTGSSDDKIGFAVSTGFALFPIAVFIYLAHTSFGYVLTRFAALLLFGTSFVGIITALLIPEVLTSSELSIDSKEVVERRIFLAVVSAGMMGGMMKYLASHTVKVRDTMKLWSVIHASIVGLFVALVLFLVLRAGIVNQNQIDTFNIWGITGVSAISGFFAEKVIDRFMSIYDDLIGTDKK